jgi:hypothetical protein
MVLAAVLSATSTGMALTTSVEKPWAADPGLSTLPTLGPAGGATPVALSPTASPTTRPVPPDPIAGSTGTIEPAVSPPVGTPPPSPGTRPAQVISEERVAPGIEPTIAASPFTPGLLALTYQNVDWDTMCGHPGIALSSDAGASWRAVRTPWGSRCVDIHAVIAWGPGPGPGTSRLWSANAVGAAGGVALATAYTDDLGGHWSRPSVERFTPGWLGCFPMIAVDDNPGSPNFGTLFAAYNWKSSDHGTAISVLASRDGAHWTHANIAPLGLEGYPYSWLFGPRIAFDGHGGTFVSFYEADLHDWSPAEMFHENTPGNIGRAGYAVARVGLTRRLPDGSAAAADRLVVSDERWAIDVVPSDRAAFNPSLQSSLVVDTTGRIWLAVNDKGSAGGRVHLGASEDAGSTWTWRTLTVPGLDSFKPSMVGAGDVFFVGWHAMDGRGRIHTYFAVSHDGGVTFAATQQVTGATYVLPGDFNDTGLRENADFADGLVYWAWGDNRSGKAVYVAAIEP